MAVYTEVTSEALEAYLSAYDLGALRSCKGIAEGVENSNFLLQTSAGRFILTLYEKRVKADDLPFFLTLMEHLAARGLNCPQPVPNRDGKALGELAGRPAALVTFLDGLSIKNPDPHHCDAVGEALAGLHRAGADFPMRRINALSVATWPSLFEAARDRADEVAPGLTATAEAELDFLREAWPTDLPTGVIHADLFADNVFFLGDRLSGLIDFYFACTDAYAYDLAICLNAWCFDTAGRFQVARSAGLIAGYNRIRPLAAREVELLPVLARGAALRFMLTRLVDWLNVPPGALVKPKDPLEYLGKLRFHQGVRDATTYGDRGVSTITIWTDGACSGNPGPGGWGAILRSGETVKEVCGGDPATTNNRMELMAAIAALEALKRPCTIDVHTDSQYLRGGVMSWMAGWKRNGWKTADKKPVKNIELWQRLDAAAAPHKIAWHWVKGHAGHDMNERADELARQGMAPFLKR